MTLSTGSRIGPYEILALLGAGGMGEVYRARDTRLERTVAIKVLPSHPAHEPRSSADARQRFEREAKTISQLSHPHICALFDVGLHDGTDYFVMEYLEGETLSARLTRGAVPLEETLRYGADIAAALDHAHRQGIVHRDLKPGNVMVTRSGVKLLDFGLAKVIAAAEVTSAHTKGNLTQAGVILGTLQYMAPEQLEGKTVDARTDIYALGALLYELATGKRAFSGVIAPMTPASFDRVVRRCLEQDPERRWQNARDVGLELEDVAAAPAPPAQPARRSAWSGWIAAAVLLASLLATWLVPWQESGALTHRIRFTIPAPADAAIQGMLALSPDGRMLAFVAAGADGRDVLYLRALDSLESRVIAGTEGAAQPFWSPDSEAIAFFAQRKLKRIAVAGGSVQTLCDAEEPRGGTWSSRGTILFSVNGGGEIHRVAENGGQPAELPAPQSTGSESYRWPSFLPDGSRFLYFLMGADPDTMGIYLASLDSPGATRIVAADSAAMTIPGYLIFRVGTRVMAQRFNSDRPALTGDAFPIADDVRWDSIATGGTALSASTTGLIAWQSGGPAISRLLVYDRSGRELRTLGPDGAYWEPTLSPDDRWLAVPRFEPEKFESQIWTIDLTGGTVGRLSTRGPILATVVWSPDGRQILYSSYTTGEVLSQDPLGAGGEKVLFTQPRFTPLGDWSRDRRLLFFDVFDFKRFHSDIGVRDLETGTTRMVLQADFNQSNPRLSPDGRWLAYESDESGDFEIFVRSFPEGSERRRVSTGGGRQATWRGDGRELFYVSPDRKIMAVTITPGPPFDASAPTALFQTRILPLIEARNHYDVTQDGQRFVVNSRRIEDAALSITVVLGFDARR